MAIGKEVTMLEKKIGYQFRDLSYLECAVTHSSYTNEQRARGINLLSNERLEFLGDAVLQIIVSEYLYENFKKYREGALTKMRQKLVCEKTLAKIATRIELGEHLNIGHGEEGMHLRMRPKILADAFEALIAAVYLDSGDGETCKNVVLPLFFDEFINVASTQNTDYKTLLQQLAEKDGAAVLEYKVVSEQGPEHNKKFEVVALINNNEVGRGASTSKKDAEMQAAKMALRLFGVSV